jgi:hypothetical protein
MKMPTKMTGAVHAKEPERDEEVSYSQALFS